MALLLGGPTTVVAQHFESPTFLNTNAGTDSGYDGAPQIATDGAGTWVAVWDSNEDLGLTIGDEGDIFVSRSTDAGATWTAPAALNSNATTDSGGDGSPQVTTDGAGNWVAVWISNDDLGGTIGNDWDVLFARSTDNGATWTAPAALNSDAAIDSKLQGAPQVTTDGAGNWVAIWFGESDSLYYDLFSSRSTDDGATWTAAAPLVSSGHDLFPEVSTDGSGNWVAIWECADGPGGMDFDILIARSTDNGATWGAAAVVNSDAAADSKDDRFPDIATDGAGQWVATWTSDSDISIARSTDNGATWTARAELPTNDPANSGNVSRITTDGAGTWVATWNFISGVGGILGTDYDVVVARSTDNGATWTAPVALKADMATDDRFDSSSQVATDGAGNWVATWRAGTHPDDDDIMVALEGPCFDGPLDTGSCLIAPSTKFRLANSANPAGDKLAWQWNKGEGFDQIDLGNPLDDTRYALCVYDTSASVPSLAAWMAVEPSSMLWESRDPGGFEYDDKEATSNGVTKLQLRTGTDTRTKIKLSAKGTNLTLPEPFGMTYFAQSPKVIAQLVNADGACWTSEFVAADARRNDATSFKATTR